MDNDPITDRLTRLASCCRPEMEMRQMIDDAIVEVLAVAHGVREAALRVSDGVDLQIKPSSSWLRWHAGKLDKLAARLAPREEGGE